MKSIDDVCEIARKKRQKDLLHLMTQWGVVIAIVLALNSPPAIGDTVLFSDDFLDGDYLGWTVVDEGTLAAPSSWQVEGGEMVQKSNIYGPDVGAVDHRAGTYAYYNDASALGWSSYSVDVILRSSDNDGIGLMFHYSDSGNYYKFEMDKQRNFRKLFKVVNGVESTMAAAGGSYSSNVNLKLTVKVIGGLIQVLLDGQEVFGGPVADSDLTGGTVALYSWGQQNAIFDNLLIKDLSLLANAGADQNVTDTGMDGSETIKLDGSASFDLNGNIVSYEWYENNSLIATGVNQLVDFNVGVHTVTLRVTDNDANIASDTVQINVGSNSAFKIVLLPDTQYYSESYPAIFTAQTRWVVDNIAAENIKFVMHEGDITNKNTKKQWKNANASLSVLDRKIPYLLVPGNHDTGINGSSNVRDTTLFNSYFPVERFSNSPSFGGVYESRKLDNHYQYFSAGGTDWLVIGLEFGPRNPVLTWANNVVAAHPYRRVIVVSHSHMFSDDTQHGPSHKWNPHQYGVANKPGGVNDGTEVWQKFLRHHPNITFVFNGHVLNDGKGRLISTGDHGNKVYQMLANFQMLSEGGSGYLRLVEIDPTQSRVSVKSYSPYLDKYLTDSQNEFEYTNVELGPPTNLIADAGPDQRVSDIDADGSEKVVLDGSRSFDPNGFIVTYEWRDAGLLIATGVSPTVILSEGTHEIELTVIDNDFETGKDRVKVTVNGNDINDDGLGFGTPENFSTTGVERRRIKLSWIDVSGENGYTIQWRKGSKGKWKNLRVRPDTTNLKHKKLKRRTKYQYRIRADRSKHQLLLLLCCTFLFTIRFLCFLLLD